MDYDKLNSRINHMLSYETDEFFININLKKEVADKLLDFQFLHVFNLISAFRTGNILLDGSDTGTGKTYTSIALCKQLNLRPFIICPKTIMPTWINVCKYFNVNPLGIVNYECIKTGKFYDINGKRIDCKFIEVSQFDKKNIIFKWKLPKYSLIIFDEAHKCKNKKSQNGNLLLSAKDQWKVLMLSATLADKPESFHIFGYMLGFYNKMSQANNWIKGMLREDKSYIGSKPKLSSINKQIFPNKGSRMRILEIGDKFPLNQISADNYFIEEDKRIEVNKAFRIIKEDIKNSTLIESTLSDNKNGKILTEILKARKLIEEIKIDIFEELIQEYLDNGSSVVVFLNFNDNINKLAKLFNTDCIVNGEQSIENRTENIKKFQNNETNLIICNISIIEGISLHDTIGNFPRVSLISPSFSSNQLIQSIGRIYRADTKSHCLQRIIFCANTVEEIICNKVKEKLKFLSKLNDNDLIDINI